MILFIICLWLLVGIVSVVIGNMYDKKYYEEIRLKDIFESFGLAVFGPVITICVIFSRFEHKRFKNPFYRRKDDDSL